MSPYNIQDGWKTTVDIVGHVCLEHLPVLPVYCDEPIVKNCAFSPSVEVAELRWWHQKASVIRLAYLSCVDFMEMWLLYQMNWDLVNSIFSFKCFPALTLNIRSLIYNKQMTSVVYLPTYVSFCLYKSSKNMHSWTFFSNYWKDLRSK